MCYTWLSELVEGKGIASANNFGLVLPFIDLDLIHMASSLTMCLKVERLKDSLRKHVLRKTALLFDLSEDIMMRPKKVM